MVCSAASIAARRSWIPTLTPESPAHMQSIPVRPSACPGLLRIVPALDGGICRVKLPCGQLTSAQATTIADVSAQCASGVLEITNRANLQIRGVRVERSNELVEALLAAGLGPATPSADDVRNLMVSPSAGIDVCALLDTTVLAKKILALLQTQPRLQELSPKFAVLLDGGEQLMMLEHPHDMWLSALPGTNTRFVFGLAGSPAQGKALAAVASEHVVALIDAVLHAFLDLASVEQTRIRHLLQTISIEEFLQTVQRRLPFALMTNVAAWQRPAPLAFAHIGAHAQRECRLHYVGAVPPLGRIQAAQLSELANIATAYGDTTLRLTPWQSVLLPNIPQSSVDIVLRELQQLGFSTRVDDSLAHVIACTGSSACVKGLADTKADALRLAALLTEKSIFPDVHLTGCARSCAAAHTAPYTLLARAEGRYDLFWRNTNETGFGKLIASDVDIEICAALVATPM
jgi:precorrin-3B synthase